MMWPLLCRAALLHTPSCTMGLHVQCLSLGEASGEQWRRAVLCCLEGSFAAPAPDINAMTAVRVL